MRRVRYMMFPILVVLVVGADMGRRSSRMYSPSPATEVAVKGAATSRGALDYGRASAAGIAAQDTPPGVRRMVPMREIVDALDTGGSRRRIDLWISFDFDSARLTRQGWEQAEALGEALRAIVDGEPASRPVFLVVGHTDAQGPRSYNANLSVRRAETVREVLVDDFDLDGRDIEIEGRGEDELLSRERTEAAHAANRRVEVIRIR